MEVALLTEIQKMAELIVDRLVRKENERTTLQEISFSMEKGEKIGLMGETGSGKTTLLKLIAGLVQPSMGSIHFQEKKVKGPEEVLLPGHPQIGYLSQHFELLNNYFVHEILEMSSKIEDNASRHLYELCKIDHLMKRRTNELSGGERQRISLAKTLTGNPSLLLLDEPFSNLDGINKKIIHQVVDTIFAEKNLGCIMVSHHPDEILPWADRLMILKNGALIQFDQPDKVKNAPENDYVKELLGE
jgi:ABC-type multidrug transport system ATPase subunit